MLTGSDVAAYLNRIGFTASVKPTLETLDALHEAHVARVPFENVDVLLGRPIDLGLAALEAKIVQGGRGGYCFEQNALFGAVLRAGGFTVTDLGARVRAEGAAETLPRSHMALRVDIEGRAWLADVGFGGDGPRHPIPMDGETMESDGEPYRIVREDPALVLQLFRGRWRDMYSFTFDPAYPSDYVMANWYTATFPRSPFVTGLTVQLSPKGARHILRGDTYTVRDRDGERTRTVTPDEAMSLLIDPFGLELPDVDTDALRRFVAAKEA